MPHFFALSGRKSTLKPPDVGCSQPRHPVGANCDLLRHFLIGLVMAALLLVAGLALAMPTAAAPQSQAASPTPMSPMSIGDDYCLGCHGLPGQSLTLDNGDTLDLFVDPLAHAGSIHGQKGYACVQCHTTVGEFPHPAFSAADLRDVTLQLNQVCARCHAGEAESVKDSVHQAAQARGEREAAVCTDCHTAHNVQQLTDPVTHALLPEARQWIPQTCAQCHNTIYEKYLTSVHGEALVGEGNPDVPTCIDCHGVHSIEDPTTAAFRLKSPNICARCHTDPQRMGKYNISTQVLSTYVSDFHGTTVVMFEKESPDAETNKPVCYDCHGVHDITRPDDPQKGLQVKENLLKRCQVCHPDATADFPTAWLSHYIPSPEKYPVVYYVNLFYKFFIPGVLGGMAVLVALDFMRLMINRFRKQPAVSAQRSAVSDQPPVTSEETMETAPAVEELLETGEEAKPVEPPAAGEAIAPEVTENVEETAESEPVESPTTGESTSSESLEPGEETAETEEAPTTGENTPPEAPQSDEEVTDD